MTYFRTAAVGVAIAILAGTSNGIVVGIVGPFGQRIGIVPALVFTSGVSALVGLASLVLVSKGFSRLFRGIRTPAWMWIAGPLGALYGYSIILAGPQIGVTATIALAIGGQVACAAVIDAFGVFGVRKILPSRVRILSIVLVTLGAALTLR